MDGFHRGWCVLLACCAASLLLPGCWSRNEINDIAVVTAIGIDKQKDQYTVSLQVPISRLLGPAISGGGTNTKLVSDAARTISETGATIMEAYRKIQQKVPREIYFTHSRIIIFGQELAQSGILPVMDFFERYRQPQLASYILVTKGKALDVLSYKPKIESLAGHQFREELTNGSVLAIHAKDFMNALMNDGIEPSAGQVEVISGYNRRKKENNRAEPRPARREDDHRHARDGGFKDDKLVGWLDDEETRGLLWIKNEVKSGSVITIAVPETEGGGTISAQLNACKTKVTPNIGGDEPSLGLRINSGVEIYENNSRLDLSDPRTVEKVEKMMEAAALTRIGEVLDKVQKEWRADIFGFGDAFYRKYPKVWNQELKKQWDDRFPYLPVRITVQVKVVGTGLSNKSYRDGFK
ncbi:spore germination protein GerC [Paenibacillus sp. HMSSN-139]|nr:spore germination protein GerC [Paenibacillus sp. HMSSN-139]